MQAVQQEIDSVKAEIQATKQELAAAEQAEDGAKVDFLRKEVNSLRKKEDSLREQQTILLRAQAPGQHCSPCQKWLKAHTCLCTREGSFPTLCCPLNVKKHKPARGDRP